MMTFKDLKKLVELPSYKEQRVPTVKALEVSGVPVVTEKVLENHGSINVYQNGYVIYRAHKRVTVFSLRDCVHYKYDAAEGAGHHIEEAEFDDYEWHIRLVLEGEDRIFMNYEIIQGKWMPSREDREYKEEILEGVDEAVSTLERMISEERVEELLSTLTDLQRKVVHIHLFHAVLLDRMNLSLKNGWQDENGNAYIICTIDEIMDSIRCARQKAVKLLDELEHEYQLIERRRQGLGKPNLLYVKDLYAGLSQSNYWKYENQTSGGLKSELPGVWKSNGSKTDINNNTDSSETDQIYSAQSGENISGEMREDERYRLYFQDKLEIPILEKNFPHDREILMEILELLVETVTSRKKFLRICGEEKPKEVVKSRLMKLDSMHIQYVMECLKSNTTQVRNIKQYLLATLYNAPTTIDSYYAAQVRHDFGWGGRSN